MKAVRDTVICLGVMLLYVPLLSAQDLSKYRNFSLGGSLAEVSKQIDKRAGDAAVIQQKSCEDSAARMVAGGTQYLYKTRGGPEDYVFLLQWHPLRDCRDI